MEQTWRWWGPEDIITFAHVRQTGATGIVTALHDIPAGTVWTREAIEAAQELHREAIANSGCAGAWSRACRWHEAIKIGEGDLDRLFDNYRQSLRNLGRLRHHDDLLQFHAGARLDAHRSRALRCRAAARRCASTRTNSPPSTASCWSAPAPRPTIRRRCSMQARAWFERRLAGRPRQAARQHHGGPARRLRPLRPPRPARDARALSRE